jgi:hypothetical protein
MATKTFLSTGTTWGTSASWSPAGVPLPADTAVFNSTSAACNIDIDAEVTSVTCTGYTHALTFNKSLTINGGTFTFGAAMSFAGLHGIIIKSSGATIISNNTPLTVPLYCIPDEFNPSTSLTVSTNDLTVTNNVYVRGTFNKIGSKALIFNNSDGSGLIPIGQGTLVNSSGGTINFTGSNVTINVDNIQSTVISITGTVTGNVTIYQTNTAFTVSGGGNISGLVLVFDQYTGTANFNGNAMQYTLIKSSTMTLAGTPPTFPDGFGLSGSVLLGTMALTALGLDLLYSGNVVDKNISITVSSLLTIAATQGLPCTLASNTPGTKFVLTLSGGSTQTTNTDKQFTIDQTGVITAADTVITFTDVDCSGGIPLYIIGSASNCSNVIAKPQPSLGGSYT